MTKQKIVDANNIFTKLQYGAEKFPTKQKKLCSYVNKNYRDAAFMTVGQLSHELGIGSATVMRAVRNLGYRSFKDLTAELRKNLINQESTYWKQLRDSWDRDDESKPSINRLAEITEQNILNLENSLTPFMLDAFSETVTLLKRARTICILGLRSSKAASYYLYYMLDEFRDNVMLADAIDSQEIYNNLINLTDEDIFVAFSLGGPNYATRTHEALNYVNSKHVPIVLITSDVRNPSAHLAKSLLLIPSPQYHYSLASVMNVLDAIIANMGTVSNKKRMKELEATTIKYDIIIDYFCSK